MRRERHTQAHIAAELDISEASVSRILRRSGRRGKGTERIDR
jgi:DNA-binding transcriptional regulator LsrR (DeoR family)